MDTKAIAFIICKNDEIRFGECIRYIQDLHVPEGYSIDILSIEEAESIPVAYNAAMESSDAKYKIYLHQDTLILHRELIPDILRIFAGDSSIGMIGLVGCRELSFDKDGRLCWDMGRAYLYGGGKVLDLDLRGGQDGEEGHTPVKAVDGFFMATQYDLTWQEGTSDGKYPYHILQCQEMLEHGRKVIIPWQAEPWCYHDQEDVQDDAEEIKAVRGQLIEIAEAGAYDAIWPIINEVRGLKDRESQAIADITEIYVLEKASRQGLTSGWWMLHTWGEIYDLYNQVRFILMRMRYQREDERILELQRSVQEGRIHKDAILSLAGATLPDLDGIWPSLLREQREEPLVSVIMAVYNGADHVGQTIESILGQTWKNMEIIIVDDASTDHSLDVIRSYQDARIKVIACEKNRNVAYSGNLGFKAAQGKYVALIGHDDLWKPDKLEKQILFLEEHPSYHVCFTRMDVVDETLTICKESMFYRLFAETGQTAKAWIRKLLTTGNCFCAPSACIRKKALDSVGYYRYALLQLQDHDLWLRLFLKGDIYIYPERLTCYRQFNDRKNLSAISSETIIRIRHEKRYVCSRYIKDMPRERFIDIFAADMLDPKAYGEKEILCEKALFLLRKGVDLGRYELADLLEDEKCRQILEEKYHIDLPGFYRLNAQDTF